MKQTIIALGAAAALGFAGAAHAIAYFGPGADINNHPTLPKKVDYATPDITALVSIAEAEELHQAAGGVGHMLFAPYYNVQEGTVTLFNLTNTDSVNGKAVKVRLRSAANSDDVYDFTLLLSPGDMWSARLYRDANGLPALLTEDNSCTLPKAGVNGNLSAVRLDDMLPDDAEHLAARVTHISEGYIEVLNMADIPPYGDPADPVKSAIELWGNIKHDSNGVPKNCAGAAQDVLLKLNQVDGATANAAGLYPSTGGLMGSWVILNQGRVATYSGNMTAIRAESADRQNGYGNIIFSPQSGEEITAIDTSAWGTPYAVADTIGGITADPLLAGAALKDAIMTPMWWDLPDMSTPLFDAIATPQDQVASLELAHRFLYNEYLADENGSVPMVTDWIVSQPTRRYYAAVNYAATPKPAIVWNQVMGRVDTAAPFLATGGAINSVDVVAPADANDNPYNGLIRYEDSTYGTFACLNKISANTIDREEYARTFSTDGGVSPGKPITVPLCGEVFVLSFTPTRVVNSTITRTMYDQNNLAGPEGWAFIDFKVPLPAVGFAATQFINNDTGRNYGATWGHRWDH